MNLNNDPSKRVVIHSTELPWQPGQVIGVQHRLLARQDDGDAQTTSIVRYEPGTIFPSHEHSLGDEIVVLEGEFADEYGSYPAGTYIKNPPACSHAPSSAAGCTLFVKYRHLENRDSEQVVIRPADWRWRPGLVNGLEVFALSQFDTTHTALVHWAPGTFFNKHLHFGGEEILVLQGTFQDEYGDYPSGTWIRSPHMSSHQPYSEPGCLIFVKVGHLP